MYNYLLFNNRIFLPHVSKFHLFSGNEREQEIILVEKVDTKYLVVFFARTFCFEICVGAKVP